MGDKIEFEEAGRRRRRSTSSPAISASSRTTEEAVKIAHEIGYPVMIKASAGGGGKGMRIARNDQEVREGFRAAEQRGALELRRRPRLHREVHRGSAPHRDPDSRRQPRQHRLSGRARMLDPAPPPEGDRGGAVAVPRRQDTRRDGRAGRRAGRGRRLPSAGTVEFIVDARKHFYFLEMNTRLQVEHPVTETGHRPRPGRADDPRRRRREAVDQAEGREAARLGHRGARLCRGPRARLPALDRTAGALSRAARLAARCGSTVASTKAPRSACSMTP